MEKVDSEDQLLFLAKKFKKHPDKFLSGNDGCVEALKHCTKRLYESNSEKELIPSRGLPQLIIEDFDDEQIWQQLETRNSGMHKHLIKLVAEVVSQKDKLILPEEEEEEKPKRTLQKQAKKRRLEEPDSSPVKKKKQVDKGKQKKKKKPKSIVDDTFFKLSELEEFLNHEDVKESKKDLEESSDEDDTDGPEDLDLFDEDLGKRAKRRKDEGVTAKFSDFFDAPDEGVTPVDMGKTSDDIGDFDEEKESSDDEDDDDASEDEVEESEQGEEEGDEESLDDDDDNDLDGEETETTHKKSVRFNLEEDASNEDKDSSEEEEDDSSEGETAEEILGKQNKSSFEKRQERLKERIAEMEDASLAEKPWQLKGETSSASRPENALLEENLEYEHTTRPAPLITEEVTERIEVLIKQRIKDKAWDDVERKIKPVEDPYDYKKRITLNQEKSKQSLAEIYEQEYLKQQETEKEETSDDKTKEHEEIDKMMDSLFSKLDALSNFHFTPKSSFAEVKIVSNMPVVSVEEVTPSTVSDAQLLAPQEVADKAKRPLKGETERTKTDKKHERREKKKKQRLRKKEQEKREKLVNKMKPGMGNKYSKLKALKELEKIGKAAGGVIKGKENMQVKSSKQFFEKLQETTNLHGDERKGRKKKKEKTSQVSSAKYKL